MKAASAALLGAALVFVSVLTGLGGDVPPAVTPRAVKLIGRPPIVVAPPSVEANRNERGKRKTPRRRSSRGVEEVRRDVEDFAVADLEVPGGVPGPLAGPGATDEPGDDLDGPGDARDPREPKPPPPPDDGDRPGDETNADGRVTVPNLIGLDKDQAEGRIEAAGLDDDDIFQRDSCKPQDTVLRQSIEPGTRVRRGTEIDFTISTGDDPDEDNSGPGSTDSGSGSSSSGSGSGSC